MTNKRILLASFFSGLWWSVISYIYFIIKVYQRSYRDNILDFTVGLPVTVVQILNFLGLEKLIYHKLWISIVEMIIVSTLLIYISILLIRKLRKRKLISKL